MRIAVAGGTGVVGSHVVDALRAEGNDAVVLSRRTGVDLTAGAGLDAALDGVDAVIDTANVTTVSAGVATRFFEAATGNLVAAAARARVAHVVLLSIVGIDRIPHDYLAGKLAQERVVETGTVPWTILRATQFHEFAGQVFERAKVGPLHVAPRGRVQPVAAREVGAHLAALAAGAPQGRAADLAGPREERLDDMVKAYARRTGHGGWIPSVSLPGGQMKGMRAGLGLPGPGAVLGTETFAQWLDGIG
ncbi:SDR family oxidoreductase [Microbacterium sp. PRC9]|uniref:SDR family oxidoreductase n=1 Tax=Microbacterium sp. PRC9 TaxID=2962591 RepID=UPI00288142EE|nr:SDR family oxidoreductase [Microbacterium sp. PRC9]MDT0140971.1 SDR family oxidoreductase [Microbacterium sp. PRC9]